MVVEHWVEAMVLSGIMVMMASTVVAAVQHVFGDGSPERRVEVTSGSLGEWCSLWAV